MGARQKQKLAASVSRKHSWRHRGDTAREVATGRMLTELWRYANTIGIVKQIKLFRGMLLKIRNGFA
jgi:hypothetical protein